MKALLLAAAILAASSSTLFAQGADTPFAGVDPNASQPFVATEEARNQLQAEIFKNPGSYDPQWIQIHANALRADGRHTDADALALFAALRKSTYDAICRQESFYYGQRVRNPYEAAIADLVYFQKFGRRSVDLKPALDVALRLDATAPFAYRPVDDWCPNAFDRVPSVDAKGEQKEISNGKGTFLREWVSIKLRDEAGFDAEHARQRDWLTQTTLSVIEAERISTSRKLPLFAAGVPGGAGTPLSEAFLKLFRPTFALTPQNDEYSAIGAFGGSSADGSAIMYRSPVDVTNYYARLADQKRIVINEPVRFIAGLSVPTSIKFSDKLCEDGAGPEGTCKPTLRYSLRLFEAATASDMVVPVPGLDANLDWTVLSIEYDRHSSVAVVKVGAMLTKAPSTEQTVVTRPPSLARAFVVIDVIKGITLATVTNETVPELFGGSTPDTGFAFALNAKGQPVLASVDIKRKGAEAFRINVIDGTKTTSALSFPRAVGQEYTAAEWFAKGYDFTAVANACESYQGRKDQFAPKTTEAWEKITCLIVGLTPDKKYWLLRRQFVGTASLLVMRADNFEVAGDFEIGSFGSYVLQSASESPFVILIRFGPNVQAYRYEPSAK